MWPHPGLPAPGSKKYPKQSQKSLRSLKIGETLTATRKDRYRISAIIFSSFGMGESAFYCANHRFSGKCQQLPEWKIHRFFRWKMPFAVFRSGSGVSDKTIFFETPETLPRLFRTLFGPQGRTARETLSETLRGFRALWARETPVMGGRDPNSSSSIPSDRSAKKNREHQSMETACHHICICHVILMGLGQELNLHLPLQCNSEFPTRKN